MEANPNLSSEGEAAQASQLLEIINGDTLNAPERKEELEIRDVWSVEMGDDSVFYSDEEQAHQDRGAAVCSFSFSAECKHLVNSVADYETDQQKNNPGEESRENSGREVIWTEEATTKLQNKTTYVVDTGRSVAEPDPEKFGRTCEDFLSPDFTALNTQTHYGLNESSAKAKCQIRKKCVMEEADRSHPDPCEETCTKVGENTDVPKEPCVAELQKADKTFEEDLESNCNFQVTSELPQDPDQDHSASDKSNESACTAFNHLSSSKYSTVSYRRIQRGNTRQKIEEFEIMLKNQ